MAKWAPLPVLPKRTRLRVFRNVSSNGALPGNGALWEQRTMIRQSVGILSPEDYRRTAAIK